MSQPKDYRSCEVCKIGDHTYDFNSLSPEKQEEAKQVHLANGDKNTIIHKQDGKKFLLINLWDIPKGYEYQPQSASFYGPT